MNITSETLVKAVQKVIFDYEESNSSSKKINIQQLADNANSSYTTIREIKKGLLKNLSVKKAIEISSRLNGPSTLQELIKLTEIKNPEVAEDYKRRFSHLFEYNMMPENLEELFHDKNFAKIIWAAFGSSHITREEIKYRWGQEGEERLNLLLEKGLLVDEDGTIKGVAENAGFGIKSTYKQLGLAYPMYNPERSKEQKNWISFQTNSVNDKFITDFREDLRELFGKFDKKSDSCEYRGNKRMFFGMIFDRFLEDIDKNMDKLQ